MSPQNQALLNRYHNGNEFVKNSIVEQVIRNVDELQVNVLTLQNNTPIPLGNNKTITGNQLIPNGYILYISNELDILGSLEIGLGATLEIG